MTVSEEFLRQVYILHHAIKHGMFELVAETIRDFKAVHGNVGQLLEYPDEDFFDSTALQIAVRHHHKENCTCMIAFNETGKKLISPCNEVINNPNIAAIVRILLENGADIEASDAYGLQPIRSAIQPKFYFSDPAPEVIPILCEFLPNKRHNFHYQ